MGGEIEVSPLQVQGSRHLCYATPSEDGSTIELGIGCHIHTISDWIEKCEYIGKSEEYSIAEIEEYREYIMLFAKRYAPKLLEK